MTPVLLPVKDKPPPGAVEKKLAASDAGAGLLWARTVHCSQNKPVKLQVPCSGRNW